MPTSPKVGTCIKIVSQIEFAAHYSGNQQVREKNLQNPNEVWCTEQNMKLHSMEYDDNLNYLQMLSCRLYWNYSLVLR